MLSLGYYSKKGGASNWGSIGGDLADQADLDTRFQNLENKHVKAIWFESIASGTTGTITLPTGGTVKLDQFAEGVDALVCGISGGFPTYESVRDASGNIVAATLDGDGNYTLSGTPSGYPVALLYYYRVNFESFDETKSLGEYEKDVIKYSEIQNIATQTLIGRNSAGTGIAEAVSAPQALDWIGSTRGQVLYRGNSNWSALNPGQAGQFLRSAGSGADPAWAHTITVATPVASTSGTSIDFTGIPAGTKRITVMFNLVSTNGTSNLLIQIGDAGGIENTGYTSASRKEGTGTSTSTAGFIVTSNVLAAEILKGIAVLDLEDSANFGWISRGHFTEGTGLAFNSTGVKDLSAELTQIRITTVNGTDTFDGGTINISYE